MFSKSVCSLLVVTVLLTGISCSKSSGGGTTDTIASIVTQGTWKVHLFLNDTKDETANYSTYTFTFNSNGSMTAVNGGVTTNGTWTETVDSGKTKFVLKWAGGGIPVLLLQIEEDWILKTKSATMIELTDVTATNNDEIHFQKM